VEEQQLAEKLSITLLKFNSTAEFICPGHIRIQILGVGKVIELTYQKGAQNGARDQGCRLEQIVRKVLSQNGFEIVSFTLIS